MEFFIIAAVLIFLVIIVLLCLKSNDEEPSDNKPTNQYKPRTQAPPKQNTPQQTIGNINSPALTNHARERMSERMNICDEYSQVEMMKRAYQYGKTADRTTGDLRAQLERTQEKHSDEEKVVAKFYNGSIFIFATEDNVLKTVFPYDNNYDNGYYH